MFTFNIYAATWDLELIIVFWVFTDFKYHFLTKGDFSVFQCPFLTKVDFSFKLNLTFKGKKVNSAEK